MKKIISVIFIIYIFSINIFGQDIELKGTVKFSNMIDFGNASTSDWKILIMDSNGNLRKLGNVDDVMQNLSISGDNITLSNGGGTQTVTFNSDNLGFHNLSEDLKMNSNSIVNVKTLSLMYNDNFSSYQSELYSDNYELLFKDIQVGVKKTPTVELDIQGGLKCYNIYPTGSDFRLKEDILPLENSLNRLMKVNVYTYNYKEKENNGKLHYGLIAQELSNIFPELVLKDAEGYLMVTYDELVPVLLQGINEQQDILNQQIALTKNLKKELSNQSNSSIVSSQNFENWDIQSVLFQNIPNPSSSITTIPYSIPDNTKNAFICIYDIKGVLLKQVLLEQKGYGQISIDCSVLEAGMYIYNLIVDGNEVDAKKMIIYK